MLTAAHRWCAALNGSEELTRLGGVTLPECWQPGVVIRRYALNASIRWDATIGTLIVDWPDGSRAERIDGYWHVVGQNVAD